MDGPAVAIVLGAGDGTRLQAGTPKAFVTLGDRPILAHAVAAAAASPSVSRVVAVVPVGWEGRARDRLAALDASVAVGASTRQGSVRAALAEVPLDVELVVVHDAARPFASPDLFDRVLRAIGPEADAAVPVVPATDTVLRLAGDAVIGVEDRDELGLAQTPQAFRCRALREAHAKAEAADRAFTDDASLLRWAGFGVRTVPGEIGNEKITTRADLDRAERRVRGRDG